MGQKVIDVMIIHDEDNTLTKMARFDNGGGGVCQD